MAIITETVQINEKNTRTAGQGKTVSFQIAPKSGKYASAFVPKGLEVQNGEIYQISGRLVANGDYLNVNFPQFSKVWTDNVVSTNATAPFGETTVIDVPDDELPF